MKYIIMCGGDFNPLIEPRHLRKIQGERVVARTIRLLRKYGVEDIAISSNMGIFDMFGVPVLSHEYTYELWIDCFYPTDEPVCYIFGDVVFSERAIEKIVNTKTSDIQFFASSYPFGQYYPKNWAEPFAFKVVNQKGFRRALDKVRGLDRQGKFKRSPIAWELWQVIKGTDLNVVRYNNYIAIDDYTCDIDEPEDLAKIEEAMREYESNQKLHVNTFGI